MTARVELAASLAMLEFSRELPLDELGVNGWGREPPLSTHDRVKWTPVLSVGHESIEPGPAISIHKQVASSRAAHCTEYEHAILPDWSDAEEDPGYNEAFVPDSSVWSITCRSLSDAA